VKILLATDGSEYSEGAAKFLTRFNFTQDDEIAIYHAISWVPILSEWESLYADFKEIRDVVAPRILDSSANILKKVKAKISSSFTEDYPDKAIVKTSEESGADIIVMGARGMRGIGSHIVGSVTKLVAINSKKPVLVIKPSQKEKSGAIKILFATDGSVHSEAIGKVMSSIPFPDDTEVTILNVIFSALSDIPERFSIEIDDRIKKIVAGEREKDFKASEKIIEKTHKGLRNRFSVIEELTKFGDPPVEILNAAEALNADIITVGTSGMRGIRGMLGSVSRYILNHSKCSVLIGKT
jgi:nucleotide-binding universal stress UspA family protein